MSPVKTLLFLPLLVQSHLVRESGISLHFQSMQISCIMEGFCTVLFKVTMFVVWLTLYGSAFKGVILACCKTSNYFLL